MSRNQIDSNHLDSGYKRQNVMLQHQLQNKLRGLISVLVLAGVFVFITQVSGQINPRITLAEVGEFPFVVSIQVDRGDGIFRQICLGAIINERNIVTAAKCVETNDRELQIWAQLGCETVRNCKLRTKITKIVVNRQYEPIADGSEYFNIALLRTDGPIPFGNLIRPIDFSPPRCDGKELIVDFAAFTKPGQKPDEFLSKAKVRSKPCSARGESFKCFKLEKVFFRRFVALGAPLIQGGAGCSQPDRLIGFKSHVDGIELPGAVQVHRFTSIDQHREWIAKNLQNTPPKNYDEFELCSPEL